jgi:hypothetical protein
MSILLPLLHLFSKSVFVANVCYYHFNPCISLGDLPIVNVKGSTTLSLILGEFTVLRQLYWLTTITASNSVRDLTYSSMFSFVVQQCSRLCFSEII